MNGQLQVNYRNFMYKTVREVPRHALPTQVSEFSIWAYLYNALKLVLDPPVATRLWVGGLIYGFVSKEQARDLLKEHVGRRESSAMLVRYSEKQLGAVSVVRYMPHAEGSGGGGGGVVDVLEPWDKQALAKTSLFERLLMRATNERPVQELDGYSREGERRTGKPIELMLIYGLQRSRDAIGAGVANGAPAPEVKSAAAALRGLQASNVEPDPGPPPQPPVVNYGRISTMQAIRLGEEGWD